MLQTHTLSCAVCYVESDVRFDPHQLGLLGSVGECDRLGPVALHLLGRNSIDILSSQNQAQNLAKVMYGVLRHV